MAELPQRFSEQQVGLILRRAGELQKEERYEDRALSLPELERVADEAGIDRRLVRRAAAEVALRRGPQPERSLVLGGPTRLVFETVVAGELAPEAHEDIIALLRMHVGEHGRYDVLGQTLSWSSRGRSGSGAGPRTVFASVRVHSGVTLIRVEEQLRQLAGGLYGGLFGGLGGGGCSLAIMPAVALGVPGLIPLCLVVWLGGVYGLTREIFRRQTMRKESQLRALLDELTALVETRIADASDAHAAP